MNKRKINRTGATAVEFALVCPIFFMVVFFCFESGRALMAESFIEEAAFRAARHVKVLGATIDEGVAVAEENLAIVGIDEAQVFVEPLLNGVVQPEIASNTQKIRVRIIVEVSDYSTLGGFFRDKSLTRTAELRTERIVN